MPKDHRLPNQDFLDVLTPMARNEMIKGKRVDLGTARTVASYNAQWSNHHRDQQSLALSCHQWDETYSVVNTLNSECRNLDKFNSIYFYTLIDKLVNWPVGVWGWSVCVLTQSPLLALEIACTEQTLTEQTYGRPWICIRPTDTIRTVLQVWWIDEVDDASTHDNAVCS